MPKYMITCKPMADEDIKKNCEVVLGNAQGTQLAMDRAYVSEENRIHCIWNAPKRAEVEALFERSQVPTESIVEVEEYSGSLD